MGRLVMALVVLWVGVAHAAPCVQRDLDAGVAGGQLFYASNPQFEDGSHVRVKAQKTPTDVRLAIAADDDEWIAIEGDFDRSAKYVGLEVNGYTMLTTPDQLYVCSRGTVLYDQVHEAKIFSVDRYGNRSEPVTRSVVAIGGHARHHIECGMYGAIMFIGSLMIAGILFVLLVIGAAIYRSCRSDVPVAGVAPMLAENVARQASGRYRIKLAIAMLTTSGLWTFHHPFLAIQLSPFLLIWFVEAIGAWLVLRRVEARIDALGRRGNWLLVGAHKVYVPRRVWAKASSLPTAGLA